MISVKVIMKRIWLSFFVFLLIVAILIQAVYVFLDAEVRKLTINSLIHVAKQMDHRQFIFITPQDLSSIQPDPKLKILKLVAPSRHHNAGGLSQQTLDFASQQ